jgi:putative nucleotidyltransferase with HDIG domain
MSTQVSTPAAAHRPWAVARLQPFPAVAARLMRMVATDDVAFRAVAELIRADICLSAEVLRLANSPLLGCRRQILSILHAVAILGLERLKGLVMMVALRNFLGTTLHVPSLACCWRHSLACAFLAQDLGAAYWLDRDQCYTAGLMHDLGRLALMGAFPAEYAELLESFEGSSAALLEAERQRFEIDHCAVGSWLISEWNLPEGLLDIVGTHHADPRGDKVQQVDVIRVACRLADVLGFQVAGSTPGITWAEATATLSNDVREKLGSEDELLVDLAGRINAVECSLMG